VASSAHFTDLCASWDEFFVSIEDGDQFQRGEWLVSCDTPLTVEQRDDICAQLMEGKPGQPLVLPHGARVAPVAKNWTWTCEYCGRHDEGTVYSCRGCGAKRP
jgi:hypothetical protein